MRTMLAALLGSITLATSPAAAAPPPAELVAAGKAQVGSYRCKGHVVDGDKQRAVSARLVVSLDLDGQWLVWRLTQDRSKTVKRPLRHVIYRAFDPAAHGWRAVQIDNTGGRAELAAPDGATWTGTLVTPTASVGIRDHQEVAPRAIRLWGEYENEPGVFVAGYDVTCRR